MLLRRSSTIKKEPLVAASPGPDPGSASLKTEKNIVDLKPTPAEEKNPSKQPQSVSAFETINIASTAEEETKREEDSAHPVF